MSGYVKTGMGWRCDAVRSPNSVPTDVLSRYPSVTEFWDLRVSPYLEGVRAPDDFSFVIGHVAVSKFGYYPVPRGYTTKSWAANAIDTFDLAATGFVIHHHRECLRGIEFVPLERGVRTLRITRLLDFVATHWATVTEVTEAGQVLHGILYRAHGGWHVLGRPGLQPTVSASEQVRALVAPC